MSHRGAPHLPNVSDCASPVRGWIEGQGPGMTLQEALRDAVAYRWAGMRSLKRNRSQAEVAVATLEQLIRGKGSTVTLPSCKAKRVYTGRTLRVEDVRKEDLKRAVRLWLDEGTQPATVITRLSCLSAMGLDVRGCRPRLPRKLKWWLNPQQEAVILAHLRQQSGSDGEGSEPSTGQAATSEHPTRIIGGFVVEDRSHGDRVVLHLLRTLTPADRAHTRRLALADLIVWTGATGLRIEESLNLRWSDIHKRDARTLVTVPGLKTHMAQATLPLSAEATAVLARRRPLGGATVFGATYAEVLREWVEARKVLGLEDPSVATLKALRRTAARSLHATKGMPLDMTRQYLRHENVQTTMGYLRLTGGYGEAEISRWL